MTLIAALIFRAGKFLHLESIPQEGTSRIEVYCDSAGDRCVRSARGIRYRVARSFPGDYGNATAIDHNPHRNRSSDDV